MAENSCQKASFPVYGQTSMVGFGRVRIKGAEVPRISFTLSTERLRSVHPGTGELPLQLFLARGHQCVALMESGEVKSLRKIARKARVDSSYASRMVNLTALAPDIVEAILHETLPPGVTLFDLAVDPLAPH